MAKKNHITFNEFQEQFNSEQACREYLLSVRTKEGLVCPRCGCIEYYWIESRYLLQCRQCKHQVSLTSDTVMHKTHLPLKTWFWAIYLVAYDNRKRKSFYRWYLSWPKGQILSDVFGWVLLSFQSTFQINWNIQSSSIRNCFCFTLQSCCSKEISIK